MSENSTPLLEVRNLKKYYRLGKGAFGRTIGYVKAVDGVSFSIGRNETFGLVGESGCGKTTIGKAILRLTEANEGEIFFDGRDLLKLSAQELARERRNIQMVFQDPYGSLNPHMNIEETLMEPFLWHRLGGAREARERVRELLEMVELPHDALYKYPHEFSGGQRQRIVIARALSCKPQLIVCDEPVSALDVSIQAQILNLFKRLQEEQNVSYLFIAHGLPVVKHVSHRLGVMYLGKLMEVLDASDIYRNSIHPYTQALMSAIPIPDPTVARERQILQGEIPNPLNPPPGCKFSTRCPYAGEICTRECPQLREVQPNHFVACHFAEKFAQDHAEAARTGNE